MSLGIPVFVLSHGRPSPDDFPPGSSERADEQLWRELQRELVELVPGTKHALAERSGHDIPTEQPEAVFDAVTQVVTAVRHPATW